MSAISADTMDDTVAVVAKIADDVEEWIALGHRPHLPDALVKAAERIANAMQLLEPTAAMRNLSLGQLVIRLLQPHERATAGKLLPRIHLVHPDATIHAVSVAMHRCARRGLLQRHDRGVYGLPADARREGPQPGTAVPAPP